MFDFDNKNIKPGSMLAAKFFTKRALSVEVVAQTFRPLWKTKQEFRIKDLGNHLILFTFEDELDAEKIRLVRHGALTSIWLPSADTKLTNLSRSFVLTKRSSGFRCTICLRGE